MGSSIPTHSPLRPASRSRIGQRRPAVALAPRFPTAAPDSSKTGDTGEFSVWAGSAMLREVATKWLAWDAIPQATSGLSKYSPPSPRDPDGPNSPSPAVSTRVTQEPTFISAEHLSAMAISIP